MKKAKKIRSNPKRYYWSWEETVEIFEKKKSPRKAKLSFEDFFEKSGIKDRMEAGFFYHQFLISGLDFEEWNSGIKTKKLPPSKLKTSKF
jgi:hypothetical protein